MDCSRSTDEHPVEVLTIKGDLMDLRTLIDAVASIPGAVEGIPFSREEPPDRPTWLDDTRILRIGGSFQTDAPQVSPAEWEERLREGRDIAFEGDERAPSETTRQPTEPPPGWVEEGTEFLAWYRAFHRSPWDWGVYIRAFGIEVVATELAAGGVPTLVAAELAYQFLLTHELGHFETELLLTGVELASANPWYLSGRRQQRTRTPWGLTEEGLCNARGRSSLPTSHRRTLDGWLSSSPVGYRDWRRHAANRRAQSWGEVVGDLTQARPLPWSPRPVATALRREVPVMLVLDGNGPGGHVQDAFVGPILVTEEDSFWKDLKRSGNETLLRKRWADTKKALASGAAHTGRHLEKIAPNLYSVRMNDAFRAGLLHNGPLKWSAVMADQQHDRLYQRMKRKYRA